LSACFYIYLCAGIGSHLIFSKLFELVMLAKSSSSCFICFLCTVGVLPV